MQKDQFLFKTTLLSFIIGAAVFATQATAQGFAATESRIEILSEQRLTATQAQAMEKFRSEALYFGALYVSENGAFGWHRNVNTIEAAKVLAQQSCERHGSPCGLYATLVPNPPAGRQAFQDLAMSTVQSAFVWIRGNRGQSSGAAMAASGYWGYHTAVRGSGVRRAERDALRACQSALEDNINDWLEPDQIAALEAAELLECRIVVSIRER